MSMNFTSDEEIDACCVVDNTVRLVGYVDDIISIKPVGKMEKKLYKIIVNNGSNRRVRVLFWKDFALEWHSQITSNVIIDINRGRPTLVNQTYVDLSDGLAPMELTIVKCTKVKLGPTYSANAATPVVIKEISIQDFQNTTENAFYITAYVKVVFENITAGGSSYGCGAIADGTTKIVVKIAVFDQDENIEVGSTVKILGSKKEDKNGNMFIQVNDSNDITLIHKDPVDENKIRGFRTPKRSYRSPLAVLDDANKQKTI
ncbi:uncharacterized protein [Chelonus insularis]|uniref:uncharacterized protein n=1 Tax=Chelonus insularis TaxID=460826 RepID=UPI00158A71D7|nr:uncharacterized protein LOC118070363 [Chelonus insularis]